MVNTFSVGNIIKLISIPNSVTKGIQNDPDSTYEVLRSMLNKPRRIHSILNDMLELMTFKTKNGKRIYHFVLVEPDCVKLISKK